MLLQSFLVESAMKYPDKEAVVCDNHAITYQELNCNSDALANALLSRGIERHDRITISLENSIEVVTSIFAILKCGAVFSVIDPQIKENKLAFILRDCQSSALITDTLHLQVLEPILSSCANLKMILLTDGENGFQRFADNRPDIVSYGEMIDQKSSPKPISRGIDVDLASLIYTSGSTGDPKGVMLTHLNMVSAVNSICEYLENSYEDIILSALPLSFDYGLYQVLMSCKFGGTILLEKSFAYPFQIIDILVRHRVTGFPIVPTIAALLLRLKNLSKFDFSHLRYITSTGQALPVNHLLRLQEIFPNVKVFSMYGLTECKRVSYLPPGDLNNKPSSVGFAMPNTEVYLVDDSGRVITCPDEIGELVVRGSTVMRGYWNRPVDTARALRPGIYPGEQVLYSGDLFKRDKDGYLYFVSRRDQMFKSGGEMVSPKEIENVLSACPGISEAAVIRVEDEILGSAIKAFVVVDTGLNLSESAIVSFCSRQLKSSMIPKYIEFISGLPKDRNGKVQKSCLM